MTATQSGELTGEFDDEDSIVFLFWAMEQAKTAGEFERAAAAKRRLEQLGVKVKYEAPQQTRVSATEKQSN
jgi:hypothetical protein